MYWLWWYNYFPEKLIPNWETWKQIVLRRLCLFNSCCLYMKQKEIWLKSCDMPLHFKKGPILKSLFSVGFNSSTVMSFRPARNWWYLHRSSASQVSNPNCTIQRQHSSNSSTWTVPSAFQRTSSYSQHLKFPPLRACGYPAFLKYSMREGKFQIWTCTSWSS